MDWRGDKATDQRETLTNNHVDDMRSVNQKAMKESSAELDAAEPERSAGHYPLIVPVNHDLNNDIYFIGKRSSKFEKEWLL